MKKDKALERLAALYGVDVPPPPTPEEIQESETVSREAESVLAFIENPEGFRERNCGNCNKVFTVNRANVAFCSDRCRKVTLESKGIRWNPDKKPEERWAGTEPLVVTPEALENLKRLGLTG